MEIARDFITTGSTVTLLAKVDGKRVRFVYPDRETAFKAYKKLRKGGADFLDTRDEGQASRWAGALIARDENGKTW